MSHGKIFKKTTVIALAVSVLCLLTCGVTAAVTHETYDINCDFLDDHYLNIGPVLNWIKFLKIITSLDSCDNSTIGYSNNCASNHSFSANAVYSHNATYSTTEMCTIIPDLAQGFCTYYPSDEICIKSPIEAYSDLTDIAYQAAI